MASVVEDKGPGAAGDAGAGDATTEQLLAWVLDDATGWPG
jgi:hypothetical protein